MEINTFRFVGTIAEIEEKRSGGGGKYKIFYIDSDGQTVPLFWPTRDNHPGHGDKVEVTGQIGNGKGYLKLVEVEAAILETATPTYEEPPPPAAAHGDDSWEEDLNGDLPF